MDIKQQIKDVPQLTGMIILKRVRDNSSILNFIQSDSNPTETNNMRINCFINLLRNSGEIRQGLEKKLLTSKAHTRELFLLPVCYKNQDPTRGRPFFFILGPYTSPS